jgi:hypothetical protein
MCLQAYIKQHKLLKSAVHWYFYVPVLPYDRFYDATMSWLHYADRLKSLAEYGLAKISRN